MEGVWKTKAFLVGNLCTSMIGKRVTWPGTVLADPHQGEFRGAGMEAQGLGPGKTIQCQALNWWWLEDLKHWLLRVNDKPPGSEPPTGS